VKPRDVTLAFRHYFNKVGFGELIVYDFWFVKSPSCDFELVFRVCDETKKLHPHLQVFV
jgi:hypothetical protein